MIISHKHKYLFVEVPHTASSAISEELRRLYDGESILYKHANLSEARSNGALPHGKYFKFATVRNPLDVVVTEYAKLKSNHRGVYTDPTRFARNGGWVPDSHLEKFRFIKENGGDFSKYFERFYDSVYHNWFLLGHDQLDFVMRYENLEEDFGTALSRIGLKQARPIPLRNKTDRQRDFRPYYIQDIHDRAALVFGPFMAKWGYSLPKEWGTIRVPTSRRARFSFLELLVNLAGRFVTLSPHSPVVRKLKGVFP